MPENEGKEMLSVNQAAQMLDVSPRRVRQFVSEGRLPAYRLTPRCYVLARKDVERFARIERKTGRQKKI